MRKGCSHVVAPYSQGNSCSWRARTVKLDKKQPILLYFEGKLCCLIYDIVIHRFFFVSFVQFVFMACLMYVTWWYVMMLNILIYLSIFSIYFLYKLYNDNHTIRKALILIQILQRKMIRIRSGLVKIVI